MTKEEIKKGGLAKIRLQGNGHSERVWTEVLDVDVENQTLKLRIDNHPVNEQYAYNEILEDIPVLFVLDYQEKIQ